MTELLLEDRRRKLLRAKVAVGLVLGGTLSGLFDDTLAYIVVMGNAFIWVCWYMALSHEARGIGRIQLKEDQIRKRLDTN